MTTNRVRTSSNIVAAKRAPTSATMFGHSKHPLNMTLHMSRQAKARADANLLQLSLDLTPAETDLEHCTAIAKKIFSILQTINEFSIDRSEIIGSVGKKTAIAPEFDLDCVIFINDVNIDDFRQVLKSFKQALESEESMSGATFNIPKLKIALFDGNVEGFKINIVPAINFSQNNAKQREKTLQRIKLDYPEPSRDWYRYSSSLIHGQVEFLDRQTPFTINLIRLAKYWNRSIYIGEYVAGRTTLIEVMAVYAAQLEDRSLIGAFSIFLDLMRNLKLVNITFDMFYPLSEVNEYLLEERPLVLDPTNPYNNLAHDLFSNNKVRKKFELFAEVSIQRLGSSVSDLFAMQPHYSTVFVSCSRRWLVDVGDCMDGSRRVKFFILSRDAKSKDELKREIENEIQEMEKFQRGWEFVVKSKEEVVTIGVFKLHAHAFLENDVIISQVEKSSHNLNDLSGLSISQDYARLR
uniref:2'-5'-oligoadenylate synthetase 1 domain-containing protein n=1 Tax=Strigamia maritima TaxID=126957 RepID=T1IMN7_STRMM